MDDDLAHLLSRHIDSLGPEVTPGTPLFEATDFERMEHTLSMAMKAAGVDPAIIHAFEETGMMVTEENMDAFSQTDLDLWHSKIEEFRISSIVDDDAGFNDSDTKFPLGTIAHYGPDDKKRPRSPCQ